MSDPFAVARARKALEEAGLDPTVELTRASSVTNEVWLTPKHVIRVNRHPNQRLRREAYLGPLLPADVGYPTIVAYGGEVGADFLIVERRPGGVLSRAWPSMSRDERRRAVAQLATVMRRLHDQPTPPELPPTASPQLLSTTTLRAVELLLEGIDRARSLDHVEPGMLADLRVIVETDGPALDPYPEDHLIHGDLHFENVLWDGYVITALLDFEYARPGPPDLDLDVLLRFCALPFLHVAEDYEDQTRAEDYAEIPWWLADEYPELFDRPYLYERVRLYDIAYGVRELLEMPPPAPAGQLSPHHAVNRLARVIQGESHVDLYAGKSTAFTLTAAQLVAATGVASGMPAGLPPLAPGAMAERRAGRGGPALPRRGDGDVGDGLPRRQPATGRTRPEDPTASRPATEGDEVADRSDRGTDLVWTIDDGRIVVTGPDGHERHRGLVADGAWALEVHPLGSGDAAVLLDWAEDHLPDGVMAWHPFPNLVCVGPDGTTRWRASLPSDEKCFTGVRVEGDRVVGVGWAWQLPFDARTGEPGPLTYSD